ncbi:MAG TPA: hypothetical protein DCQ83_08965 [Fibrobacteres bacterium]|jgi:uncharacterized protein (DUF1015 family)|nr:hypothetical protein [Fibrobacterota bacterium]
MASIRGLHGLRPLPDLARGFTTPPYDVIKEGSPLEKLLAENPRSFYHVTLGPTPAESLAALQKQGVLIADDQPCFYVYEQRWSGGSRLGFFAAVEVSPYAEGNVIRHEKTFDEKVKGRIAVTQATAHTLEPIFLLTRSPIGSTLESVCAKEAPLYEFDSDFGGYNDLHGIHTRVFRVPETTSEGKALREAIGENPLYIADGHHRYHAALLGGQTHAMAYIVEDARILAYNRVIRGAIPFAEARSSLELIPAAEFATPPKNQFCLYSKEGAFILKAKEIPQDVVGRLDCSILERELYPKLGVVHSMILKKEHFDYYPEWDLATMKSLVDCGEYDLAVALHPVSIGELMAVADAGMKDSSVVMPEKSTFFAPKILSGLILYKHALRNP